MTAKKSRIPLVMRLAGIGLLLLSAIGVFKGLRTAITEPEMAGYALLTAVPSIAGLTLGVILLLLAHIVARPVE
ncbi:hypothetical protein MSR1_36290 [Magnetospirillum gryphiswaldense MSR-1]|uniref:Uncharacterized protein n=2 Tax=Magnetospirillum gryphiswaldense TaxID=55518 RepID=V6F330_MAGGM|nr:hypothetical protein MSR1_36290 [Magnetospirillum gryphiswaldense MSR-1]AVM79993.1 hypothetical protein MSR1L_36290 [Magnetospirillum gryphiswaldense]CAM76848.1 membrane protein [Magnetospirillum gryphiswaldense MSR-1]CDK99940.1 protein of unknown function [Magnetospirillum gryphiswaldense MSR-1 v2]